MLEFVWLKKINFYPPPPDLNSLQKICLATKSRALGDALMLTTLPAKLKGKYPHLKIYTYPRAFNPYVFKNHKEVSGIARLPNSVFGDDCSSGAGHIIQLKERFFSLPISELPKPIIHLRQKETEWTNRWLQKLLFTEKPIAIIHPFGKTREPVIPILVWEKIIQEWNITFDFIQIGLTGHEKISGCKSYFFLSNRHSNFSLLASLLKIGKIFIGVDSGPMHIAKAFDIPSIIFTSAENLESLFERRKNTPYYLGKNSLESFLYEDNTNIEIQKKYKNNSLNEANSAINQLLQSFPVTT